MMLLPRPLTLFIDRLPVPVVQRIVSQVFHQVLRQHPDLFDRLGTEANKRFCFAPTDLDLVFFIHPASKSFRTFRKAKVPRSDATVAGPMLTLLALLEGRIDGDAVFFSRSLTVTGDMEAMLALRNALDDCSFDLPSDLAGMAGPLAGPFKRAAELVRRRALNGAV
ncbi:SCP2 domain-containing protein [Devosia albogilva]|uniref:SCP2 domain-containing protein n=1 Tax=Devosia albogilva TaxID=429726 RepID=A0ABW5QKL2_9HYPH